MTKHRMGTLHFLLFYICAIVIAAPPLNLEAPPSKFASYSDSVLGRNLTQTADNETLLNTFPSPPPTNLSLSSVANSSVESEFPPDPFDARTLAGDIIIFGVYRHSQWTSDLQGVILQASLDAAQHLFHARHEPMPPGLIYRRGYASLTLQVGLQLTWTRWAYALVNIGNFHTQVAENVSFNFELALEDLSQSLGTGQVRTYS